MKLRRIDKAIRVANECPKAPRYFHRWKVVPGYGVRANNAHPELESGHFLPRLDIVAIMKCEYCEAELWYESSHEVNVEDHIMLNKRVV
tara:strand:+ start:299 stop:565 length:267 start_codon:yes stop_codon:yes gene_type:complete